MVRPLDQILATLDSRGRLDALPFMPEMAACCGKEFSVFKRVDKVNDIVDRTGLRRMTNAVILEGVRCTGAHHGGCQALCQSIWKEAWLSRVPDRATKGVEPETDRTSDRGRWSTPRAAGCSEQDLVRESRVDSAEGDERFICQATEIKTASSHLAWWDPRQYARDLRSGNVGAGQMLRAFSFWLFTLLLRYGPGYRLLVALYNGVQKLRGGKPYPYITGRLEKTPAARLDLSPGELVQVKSQGEILETLDTRNKNRGLWFDVEMVKYCGGTYRVLCRVEKIIEPRSGRMLKFTNDCVVLEGVTTLGDHHRFYPQNEYPLWREIWLRRVAPASREGS